MTKFFAMHVDQNICESNLVTLFNVDSKTKDDIRACDDLKAMGFKA